MCEYIAKCQLRESEKYRHTFFVHAEKAKIYKNRTALAACAAGSVRSQSAREQTKDALQLKVIERMKHKSKAHAVEIN